MKRLINILVFLCLSYTLTAQEETRVVDSLEGAMATQQGAERIKTMIRLSEAFYDVSFDDGIAWGEKAMRLSREMGDIELEAEAAYVLGSQYGDHKDLDLAKDYLKKAFILYEQAGDEEKVVDVLLQQAYCEWMLGNMDSACMELQEALSMAEPIHDEWACALAGFNLGAIKYQKDDFEGAIAEFKSCRNYYESFNDSVMLGIIDLNLATCYGECGRSGEAKKLFISVIPRLEALEVYDNLMVAYKNYGLLFMRDYINYDSACHYFNKALELTTIEDLPSQDRQAMSNVKADVLAELGNVAYKRDEFQHAVEYYEEALALAERNRYHFGHMQALVGLGRLYAKQGKAAQSLHYLEQYADEKSQSGITMMDHEVRKALILDYARLGRYTEMEMELEKQEEQRASLLRENVDLYDQISSFQDETQWLLSKYETQNTKIETLQSQRDHYRLAFFGLLAIALFSLVLFVAYKIVCKNRVKNVKS